MYPFSAVINAHSLGAVCGSTADATRRNRSAATLVTFRHLRSAADLPHSCTRTPFKTVTYAVLARLRFSIFLSLPLSLASTVNGHLSDIGRRAGVLSAGLRGKRAAVRVVLERESEEGMRFAAKVNDIIGDATVGPFLEADVLLDARHVPRPSPSPLLLLSSPFPIREERKSPKRLQLPSFLSLSLLLLFPHLDAGNTSCRSRYGIRDRIGRTGRQVRRERVERLTAFCNCRSNTRVPCEDLTVEVEERTENLQGRFLSEIEKAEDEER